MPPRRSMAKGKEKADDTVRVPPEDVPGAESSTDATATAPAQSGSSRKTKAGRRKSDKIETRASLVEFPLKDPEQWKAAQAELCNVAAEFRLGDKEDIERAAEISNWLIGHAVLRFAGPGEITGIVALEDDPNERYNPRPLNESHVRALAEVFAAGGKKDRISPIRITVAPDSLDAALVEDMRKADPRNPVSPIPPLTFKSTTAERERELEAQLFTLCHNDVLLSDNDLASKRIELNRYRTDRKLARLINGHHRIRAMIEVSAQLHREAHDIAQLARHGEEADFPALWSKLNKQVADATYVVEVYKDATPPHVLAWLGENEADRPNQAPRGGEKLWTLAETQESTIEDWISKGMVLDRIAGLNRWHEQREIALSDKTTHRADSATGTMEGRSAVRQKTQKIKVSGQLTNEACLELMAHPVTNQMTPTQTRCAKILAARCSYIFGPAAYFCFV
ncbi:hypothetical protein CTheo_8878 [Ceratobasidium theobromae]|uniref:Uncharacterized protein n=1 Tax=Ceratobasidium theobromae TaxID=1582974 RepID=A0A5N5Q7D1_9AGAM|nr:hypothetical protein CTheo_8878 [Ceratobasidium theobromae]